MGRVQVRVIGREEMYRGSDIILFKLTTFKNYP